MCRLLQEIKLESDGQMEVCRDGFGVACFAPLLHVMFCCCCLRKFLCLFLFISIVDIFASTASRHREVSGCHLKLSFPS